MKQDAPLGIEYKASRIVRTVPPPPPPPTVVEQDVVTLTIPRDVAHAVYNFVEYATRQHMDWTAGPGRLHVRLTNTNGRAEARAMAEAIEYALRPGVEQWDDRKRGE